MRSVLSQCTLSRCLVKGGHLLLLYARVRSVDYILAGIRLSYTRYTAVPQHIRTSFLPTSTMLGSHPFDPATGTAGKVLLPSRVSVLPGPRVISGSTDVAVETTVLSTFVSRRRTCPTFCSDLSGPMVTINTAATWIILSERLTYVPSVAYSSRELLLPGLCLPVDQTATVATILTDSPIPRAGEVVYFACSGC